MYFRYEVSAIPLVVRVRKHPDDQIDISGSASVHSRGALTGDP